MAVQRNVAGGKSNTDSSKTVVNATADTAASKAAIVITMLAVGELKPSRWNPNVMTDEEYATYALEVKTQGRVPKPIVVRKAKSGYVIIDGEHAWKAAKDASLTHLPCEILDVDAFEAMRQTLVRNRHGANDPTRLGRLFARMMSEGDLSIRELAKRIGVTDGTIRNHLAYAKAAKVRNHYAPRDAVERISALRVKQVRLYLDLPDDKRDEWLDAGGSEEEAAKLKPAEPSAETAAESSKAPTAESPVPDDDDENDAADAENAAAEDDSDAESSPDEGDDSVAGDDDGDAGEDGDADDDQGDSPADAGEDGDGDDAGDTPAEPWSNWQRRA